MKARLILEIDYEPNGTTRDELRSLLQAAVDHMMSRGMITGETPAEVNTHRVEIEDPESRILVKWDIDDVMSQAKEDDVDITEEEAKEILATIKRRHDASIGINWEVISTHIGMFTHDRDSN